MLRFHSLLLTANVILSKWLGVETIRDLHTLKLVINRLLCGRYSVLDDSHSNIRSF